MSILSKPYTISKAAVSNGFNKTKETLKMTASETGKTLSNALNDVAKPTNDYVSHTVKNVPGYRKSDVVDTTVDDLKFKGFKANPTKATLKAIFTPVTIIPRSAWAATKSGGSMIRNGAKGAPKWAWNTTGGLVGGIGSLTGTAVKTVTGLAGAGLATIEGAVDAAQGSSKS